MYLPNNILNDVFHAFRDRRPELGELFGEGFVSGKDGAEGGGGVFEFARSFGC